MTKHTFNIVDDSGKNIGFVVVNVDSPEQNLFQSVSNRFDDMPRIDQQIDHREPESIRRNFWANIGVTHTVVGLFVGGVVWVYCWSYDLSYLWAVSLSLIAGWGSHLMWILLTRPPQISIPDFANRPIKFEVTEQQTMYLNEFEDKTITRDEMRRVGQAFVDGHAFSRPAMTKYANISQSKFHKIKDELSRLDMCFTDKGNRTILSPRGRALLRAMAQ